MKLKELFEEKSVKDLGDSVDRSGEHDFHCSYKGIESLEGAPSIVNGISEEIITKDGQDLYIIFVDKIKPKKKTYKTVGGPGDEVGCTPGTPVHQRSASYPRG